MNSSIAAGSSGSFNVTVKKISPMLAVADMQETLDFYRELLGFTPVLQSEDYAIVERDGQTIHFMKAASEEVMRCVRGHTEIYIEVSNLPTLWEHVKKFKNRHKIRDMFERDYGMTEVHINDPNGCLVFLGQPSPAEPSLAEPAQRVVKAPAVLDPNQGRFDAHALFLALDEQRRLRKMSWRQVGLEVGVSSSTMTRTRRGGRMEVDGMLAMVRWVGRSVESFTRGAESSQQS
jgi:catechol 2,3-dioxygenase-like lactoylglutathione lyase family enzyme